MNVTIGLSSSVVLKTAVLVWRLEKPAQAVYSLEL